MFSSLVRSIVIGASRCGCRGPLEGVRVVVAMRAAAVAAATAAGAACS